MDLSYSSLCTTGLVPGIPPSDESLNLNLEQALETAIQRIGAIRSPFQVHQSAPVLERRQGMYCAGFRIGFQYRDTHLAARHSAQVSIAASILAPQPERHDHFGHSRPFLIEIEQAVQNGIEPSGWTIDLSHRSVAATETEAQALSKQQLRFLVDILTAQAA